MLIKFLSLCFVCLATQASSSDDRFIKKYAMMKIYESCFGAEVVKQIRKEMKEAYAKCSAPPSYDEPANQQNIPPILLGKLPPGFALDPASQTIVKPTDGAAHQEDPAQDQGHHQNKVGPMPNVLPFRPGSFPQQVNPYTMAGGQFRPYGPFYQPQMPQAYNPMFYQPQFNPYYQQYPQFYQQPYFPSSRMSRDLDFRDRLDMISRGPAPRPRNVTCVMQELGYIDHNLEPNYEQITQRISALPVSAELKGDIQDGLQFCEKFSQCVPDLKRDVAPLSQELIKPMFFFRCYKHKKLEACIMKDIRERFTSEEDLETEGDFRSLSRSARAARDEPINDPRFDALDEMSVYLYDYLSGGNSLDFDLYL